VSAPSYFTTIPQADEVFDGKSIYLTGQSFKRCVFRSCTLIIKDITLLAPFQDCSFDNCVWHLNITVSDKDAWQSFLNNIAPAMTAILPQSG